MSKVFIRIVGNKLQPCRKQGGELASLLVFGSAISAIGAGVSSAIQVDGAAAQNEESRKWAEKEWTRQFELTNERQDQLNAEERAYNSPVNQAKLAREAGLNPAALAASQYGGLMANSAPNTNSQSVTPSVPMPNTVTPDSQGLGSMISAIGGLFDNLATAQNKGMDTKRTSTLLDQEVKNLIAKTQGQELINEGQRLENYVNKKIKNTRVKRAFQEYKNAVGAGLVSALTADNLDSLTKVNEAQKAFLEQLTELKGAETEQAIMMVENYQNLLTAKIQNIQSDTARNKAQTAAGYAQAKMFTSQAEYTDSLKKTLDGMRDGDLKLQELQIEASRIANSLSNSEMRVMIASEPDRLRALMEQCQQQGFITEKIRAEADKAITDANWAEVEKYMNCLGQALSVSSGVASVQQGAVRNLLYDQRNKIQERFTEAWIQQSKKPKGKGKVYENNVYNYYQSSTSE